VFGAIRAALGWKVPAGSSGFEATRYNRRLAGWNPTDQHLNSILAAGGEPLRRRARDTVRNNPYAASACDSFVANAVGAGIKPSWLLDDQDLKRRLQALWLAWTDEADADWLTDFYGLQALAARAMFEAGEVFVRFRERRPEDGLRVPLQLQVLESEMLPLDLNRDLGGGRAIRAGIEFDAIGRRVRYHFRRHHPGDATAPGQGSDLHSVVPAEDVMHVYKPLRPGQIRGVPWIAPSLVRLHLLDQFDDAALEKMRTTALFGIAITKQPLDEGPLGGALEAADGGDPVLGMSPGMALELAPGEGVEVIDPGEAGSSYEPFEYRNLTASASGLGVPYANVTGDRSRANYSSERGGTVESRRRIEQLQWATLIYQLCRPVARRWLDSVALNGVLALPRYVRDPDRYRRVKWITPKWEWVDPLKDRQAEALAVDQGWKSRSDVIEAEGFDAEEVDARIAADQERERRLGIVIPRTAAAEARAAEPATTEQERAARPRGAEAA
jgi:lambda family phage portal protein